MKQIFKYPLEVDDYQEIRMPGDAVILDVQDQNRQIVLWALVDRQNPEESRCFRVIGTGQPMVDDGGLVYVGSVQQWYDVGGSLVWHIFEAPQ